MFAITIKPRQACANTTGGHIGALLKCFIQTRGYIDDALVVSENAHQMGRSGWIVTTSGVTCSLSLVRGVRDCYRRRIGGLGECASDGEDVGGK